MMRAAELLCEEKTELANYMADVLDPLRARADVIFVDCWPEFYSEYRAKVGPAHEAASRYDWQLRNVASFSSVSVPR